MHVGTNKSDSTETTFTACAVFTSRVSFPISHYGSVFHGRACDILLAQQLAGLAGVDLI